VVNIFAGYVLKHLYCSESKFAFDLKLCGAATGSAHDWTKIEGHSCGKYKDKAEEEALSARESLKRYMHYYERYVYHSPPLPKRERERERGRERERERERERKVLFPNHVHRWQAHGESKDLELQLRSKISMMVERAGSTTWTLKWIDKGLDMLIEVEATKYKHMPPYSSLNILPLLISVGECCGFHTLLPISCLAKTAGRRISKTKRIRCSLKIIKNRFGPLPIFLGHTYQHFS